MHTYMRTAYCVDESVPSRENIEEYLEQKRVRYLLKFQMNLLSSQDGLKTNYVLV